MARGDAGGWKLDFHTGDDGGDLVRVEQTHRGLRAGKEESLAERDGEAYQLVEFLGVFNAFGDNPGVETIGGFADHVNEDGLGGIAVAAVDEGAIKLDEVGADLHDVLETGVAGIRASSTAAKPPRSRMRASFLCRTE